MSIAFTICSNNYLAHAKTLGDSFLKFNPGYKFVIALIDKYDDTLDRSLFADFEIIPVDSLNIPEFDELVSKYDITELNTAVKPSYFHYLFSHFSAEKVIFLDPDILVTSAFEEVDQLLNSYNIILTPHMFNPIDDGYMLTDAHILPNGIFNLGFLALSQYSRVHGFLEWWHQRVVKYGFRRIPEGQFYDQFWINYVPAFYDNYFILKHPGYNVANWNLHERFLTDAREKGFVVNNEFPLRFFHFSGYRYERPETIASYSNRFDFLKRPDLVGLFKDYTSLLLQNGIEKISKLPVYYFPAINQTAAKPTRSFRIVVKRTGRLLFHVAKYIVQGRLVVRLVRTVKRKWAAS